MPAESVCTQNTTHKLTKYNQTTMIYNLRSQDLPPELIKPGAVPEPKQMGVRQKHHFQVLRV